MRKGEMGVFKRIATGLLLIFLISITGCVKTAPQEQTVRSLAYEGELTQEKKNFLAEMSMDEDRVQRGVLYDWQAEVLKQYDYSTEYLQKKYPSHSFHLTSCYPKGRFKKFSTFWFLADNQETVYELYLHVEADGTYKCEDSAERHLLKR